MLCRSNWAHPGATATVRDTEGLMQVKMADVGADIAWPAETHLGVEISAVHVDLAAVLVDILADFADGFLKHAMCGGVGDHQGGQIVLVRVCLGPQIGNVDV